MNPFEIIYGNDVSCVGARASPGQRHLGFGVARRYHLKFQ
jgi:hypothetical protein